MKRLAVTLLALAVATALPLAAQETPPPEATETEAQTEAQMAAAPETASDPAAAAQTEAPAAQPPAGQMSPEMQAMMEAWQKASIPGPQHAQLAEHFAGTWDAQVSMWMEPGAAPTTSTGRDVTTSAFGGRHLLTEFSGSMMGQPFTGRAVTSYDNVTGKYVGHWIDSMSTGQFMTTGDYDPATQTYTFTGESPDPMNPGGMIPIRQVFRVEGPDSHVMEWYETRDGGEHKAMEIRYTRVAGAPSAPPPSPGMPPQPPAVPPEPPAQPPPPPEPMAPPPPPPPEGDD